VTCGAKIEDGSTEAPTGEETTTTSSTENGDVQAAGGEAVTAGVAFVPEVMYNGQWSPICGHYFWNNNNGAATVCGALGFSGGTHQQTRRAYSTDSMPVGSCNAGEALTSCTDGGNAWGNLEYQNGWCKAGTSVSITVTCGAKIEDGSTEAPTGEETTTTSSTENGDVQAAGGEAVTAGVAFVPEVMYNGQWSPICGHYFWNNNNGAATVCGALGFSGGTHQQTRRAYSTDSMPVGSCNAGEALTSCTDGGNGWGDFEYQNGWCKAGTSIGITVTCGAKIEIEQ